MLPVALRLWRHTRANVEFLNTRASPRRRHRTFGGTFYEASGTSAQQPRQPAPAPPVAKKAQDWKIPVHSPFPACEILKRMFEFERLSGGLGNVAEYAIAWSRSRHGGASERYNDLADELPMERRGRASDCQRSYDFTQNDLPPPLTAEHTPRSRLAPAYPRRDEHGTRLVQSALTSGPAVLLLGPAMALLAPFSASSTRSSSIRAFAFGTFAAGLARHPRGHHRE